MRGTFRCYQVKMNVLGLTHLWEDGRVPYRTLNFYFAFYFSYPSNTHVHRTWAGWFGWWSLLLTQRQRAVGWATWSREGRSPAVNPAAAAPHAVSPMAAGWGGVILSHQRWLDLRHNNKKNLGRHLHVAHSQYYPFPIIATNNLLHIRKDR